MTTTTVPTTNNNLRFYNNIHDKDPIEIIRKQNYLKELKQQIEQKSTGGKKLEQYLTKLDERREFENMNMYNPFGKGAPLRDANGNVINRKFTNNENSNNMMSNVRQVDNYEKNSFLNNPNYITNSGNPNIGNMGNLNSIGNMNGYNQNNMNQNYQNFNSNFNQMYNQNLQSRTHSYNMNNLNYPFSSNIPMNMNNLNSIVGINPKINDQLIANDIYSNNISALNQRNFNNNQNLNNIISYYNIGRDNEKYGNNRTLSANRLLEQNKNIYNQNILQDINKVYEESSNIQNYNIHTIPSRNFDEKRSDQNNISDRLYRNKKDFSPQNMVNPAKLQQTNKITNFYTLEENENNYKRKKIYQEELAKQIEEKKREKDEFRKRQDDMDRLEEESYKIHLERKKQQEKSMREKIKRPQNETTNIVNEINPNDGKTYSNNTRRNQKNENQYNPYNQANQTNQINQNTYQPNKNTNINRINSSHEGEKNENLFKNGNINNFNNSPDRNNFPNDNQEISNNIVNTFKNFMENNFNYSNNRLRELESQIIGNYKNPNINQMNEVQSYQNVLNQKYDNLKYKMQENINNEIELLKREVERKNNDLMDYLNSLRMEIKDTKHVRFNSRLGDNSDFIKNNPRGNSNNFNNYGENFNKNNLQLYNEDFYDNGANDFEYSNRVDKLGEKRSINLKSSSTMIFNNEEFIHERNLNNSNNESKISKFAQIGRNLVADSEFIPINENNENDEVIDNKINEIEESVNRYKNPEIENENNKFTNLNTSENVSAKIENNIIAEDDKNLIKKNSINLKDKTKNLDNILDEMNSINYNESKILNKSKVEEIKDETKVMVNHLKESAYEIENKNYENDLEMESLDNDTNNRNNIHNIDIAISNNKF